MLFRRILAVVGVVLCGTTLLAGEYVGVPGTSTKYPSETKADIGGKAVPLVLTGTAMRTKFFFNVYAVGSYIQQGSAVHSAEELAAADCAKRLLLVMERTVDGKDMAEAFRAAVRLNHAEPEFNDEVARLVEFMRGASANKGDSIYLTHLPGVGLHVSFGGNNISINNVAFSRAVWEIYLGKNNLGESIKKGLVSRL